MKLLYVNDFFSPVGGAEAVMISESQALKKLGHTVEFFAAQGKPYYDDQYPYIPYFPKYDSLISRSKFGKLTGHIAKLYNFDTAAKFKKALKATRPDLVHLHVFQYHLSPSIIKPCIDLKIPVVLTVHNGKIVCASDRLKVCKRSQMDCLRSNCGNKFEKILCTIEYCLNRIHRHYDYIDTLITPSAALKNAIVTAGFDSHKIVHINNFLSPYYHNVQPCYENKGYFLYAGRLVETKGVHYLIRAMKQLPETKLKIAGDGIYANQLKSLAQELELKNVEFLGHQSQESLAELYKNCIASILPCDWFEAFGLTILESLSFGKPVIASAIGAIPEVLKDGEEGILVPPASVDALVSAMRTMLEHPDLVAKMGAAGRQKVEGGYTLDEHVQSLLKVYENTLLSQDKTEMSNINQMGLQQCQTSH